MADDDPLDDVRMVAMTTAAAAARVVETAAREAEKRREQQLSAPRWNLHRRETDRPSRPGSENDTTAKTEAAREERCQAEQWASPDRREDYRRQRDAAETAAGQQSVDRDLIHEWRKATGQVDQQPQGKRLDELTADERVQADQLLAEVSGQKSADYDGQRADRDRAMREAGVPDKPRQAKTTADLLNGTDPGRAAAEGTTTKAAPARKTRAPERVRGRG